MELGAVYGRGRGGGEDHCDAALRKRCKTFRDSSSSVDDMAMPFGPANGIIGERGSMAGFGG